MLRLVLYLLPIFALAVLANDVALADEKIHDGIVVSAGVGKLTMTMMNGEKQHTHDVATGATIMLDGKAAKLEDLKAGFHVKVMTDDSSMATKIDAHSKRD